jgi:type I restriction enzyme, S subunit
MRKVYEKYRDSKIKGIGLIPENWKCTAIKHILSIPITDGPHTTPSLYDEGVPFISAEAIKDGKIDFNRKRGYISEKDYELFSKKYIPKRNDIYMVKSGATTGNVAMLEQDLRFTIWSPLAVFRADKVKVLPKFLHYYLQSNNLRYNVEVSWSYGTQQNIGMGVLSNLKISYPSINEQTQITRYLDHQTFIIDQLVQQKEKLIALLKEKRQSAINEAVTKGLTPEAKMKDSGIDWLGEIPKDWTMKRLRYLGKCQNGVSQGSEYFGSGDPFVSYGDVYKNMSLPFEVRGLARSTESDKEYYSVLEGDVFFTRTSETIEEIGLASTCLQTIENAVFAGFLIRFRPIPHVIDKNFSKYYFRSHIPRIFFIKEMNLVTRASLSQELLKSLPVLLPSLNEQKQIGAFLDRKIEEFDTLIVNISNAVLKLKEYRQSIISEAVTGKIDLRDWQPNKQQQVV